MPAADDLRRIPTARRVATAGRAPRLLGAAPGRLAGRVGLVVWIIRLLIAAAAAAGQWFAAPAVLRVGGAHALLSIAVFVGTALVLVLLPGPKQRL
jgi:hypothetical protein